LNNVGCAALLNKKNGTNGYSDYSGDDNTNQLKVYHYEIIVGWRAACIFFLSFAAITNYDKALPILSDSYRIGTQPG
jgi:hypothetical protein